MNHTLTTEQLFALDKGTTTVRELFPDLFQMKVGGYYKCDELKLTICVIEFNDSEHIFCFGFDENGFFSKTQIRPLPSRNWQHLTPEELQTFAKMLENHAIELGYKDGVRVKCLHENISIVIAKPNKLFRSFMVYNELNKTMYYGGACIFKNGIWAEILT